MKRLIMSMVAVCLAWGASATIVLPKILGSNMVLQQSCDANLWGKAEPNKKVVITTTWSKAKTVVKADADGKWFARVATPVAGGPYEVTFNDGDKLTLKNVLVGEVWICSGQSNMQRQMKGFSGQPITGATELIACADPAVPIRSCNLERQKTFEPMEECGAQWFVHNSVGVSEASATAYFFAKRLHEALRVPVGVINISWGGTPIEAWMSREVLEKEFAGEISLKAVDAKVWPEKNAHKVPTVLYNGMLKTVAPFTAKGFLWYEV